MAIIEHDGTTTSCGPLNSGININMEGWLACSTKKQLQKQTKKKRTEKTRKYFGTLLSQDRGPTLVLRFLGLFLNNIPFQHIN